MKTPKNFSVTITHHDRVINVSLDYWDTSAFDVVKTCFDALLADNYQQESLLDAMQEMLEENGRL